MSFVDCGSLLMLFVVVVYCLLYVAVCCWLVVVCR